MKKVVLLVLALVMSLSLFSCGAEENQPVPKDDIAAPARNDVSEDEELSPDGIMIDGVRYRLGKDRLLTIGQVDIKGYISEILPDSDIEGLENDGSANFGEEGLPYGVHLGKLVVYAPTPYVKGNWAELSEYAPAENVAPKQTDFSAEVVYQGVNVNGVNVAKLSAEPSYEEPKVEAVPGDDGCLPPVSLMLDGKIYQLSGQNQRRVAVLEDVEVLGYIEEILPKEDVKKLEQNGQATFGVVGTPYGVLDENLVIYCPDPYYSGNWAVLCEHMSSEYWGFSKE